MSRGYGASCRKVTEDENTLIYEYSVYNLGYLDSANVFDGMILINKSSFFEPEIHTKRKRKPNGKRVTISKVVVNYNIPYDSFIKDESIVIENCSNAWSFSDVGFDHMALRLVYKLFIEYQKHGVTPERVNIDY